MWRPEIEPAIPGLVVQRVIHFTTAAPAMKPNFLFSHIQEF